MRGAPRLLRAGRSRVLAVGAVILVVLAGVAWGARRAASLTGQGTSGQWSRVGPQVFLDRLERTADGRHIVAGGSGLFVSSTSGADGPQGVQGVRWDRVGPFSAANPVLGLSLPDRGAIAALVGSEEGLYSAAALGGPYRRLGLPAIGVHAAVVVPGRDPTIWASSIAGMWRSVDGGKNFTLENAGLQQPGTSWALTWWDGGLYGSDYFAVYRWDGDRWLRSSNQFGVVMLDPEGVAGLVASSMGDGIRVFRGRNWQSSDAGLAGHNDPPVIGIHVVSVTLGHGGLAYAGTMVSGVAESRDAGRSWSVTWPGLRSYGVVWRVLPVGPELVAATDSGLLVYQLPTPSPGSGWWIAVLGVGVGSGLLAVASIETRRRKGRRQADAGVSSGSLAADSVASGAVL